MGPGSRPRRGSHGPGVVATYRSPLAVGRVRNKHRRPLAEGGHDVEQTKTWTSRTGFGGGPQGGGGGDGGIVDLVPGLKHT